MAGKSSFSDQQLAELNVIIAQKIAATLAALNQLPTNQQALNQLPTFDQSPPTPNQPPYPTRTYLSEPLNYNDWYAYRANENEGSSSQENSGQANEDDIAEANYMASIKDIQCWNYQEAFISLPKDGKASRITSCSLPPGCKVAILPSDMAAPMSG